MAMKILHVKFKGETIDLAATAYNIWEHEMAMAQLQEASPIAHAWLLKEPKQYWWRYLFDPKHKAPDNTTNFWALLDPPLKTFKRGPLAKERKRGPAELRKLPKRSRTIKGKKYGGLHHNSATCHGQRNRPSSIIMKRKRNPPFDGNAGGKRPRGRPMKQVSHLSICEQSSSQPQPSS
ncbi:hypothetical protein Cgig2_015449 [Carnegiea gigantea]|uniref:Uncharacterized protein n=1 Tax=Carnegiea gigantea TaxID=171969 RepID=A0A9Q1JY94_9CARY|nr:hypothetical protein Cgig2_015449 [Carnegiea gigantea]